jgi:hypothetical protein
VTWYYVPCISAPATEGSSSPSDSPESPPAPWLTLSGTPTQRPLSWRGWKTRPWIARLSGLTCARSTVERGAAAWISSLPASPASRSRKRGNVEVSMTGDGSGLTSPGSSLTWDRESCSWRTSPSLFDSGYLTSSPTLPTSGSMRNGVCSPRQPLAPLTNVNASGFSPWPGVTAMDAYGSGRTHPGADGYERQTLTDRAVRMWGTPVARDDQKSPEAHMAMKANMPGGPRHSATSLTVQAKMWPTPRASMGFTADDSASSNPNAGGNGLVSTAKEWSNAQVDQAMPVSELSRPNRPARRGLPSEHGRHAPTTPKGGNGGSPRADLNPRFVAALMGVPWDWLTPCTSVATDSFHAWQQQHSVNSSIEPAVIDGAA